MSRQDEPGAPAVLVLGSELGGLAEVIRAAGCNAVELREAKHIGSALDGLSQLPLCLISDGARELPLDARLFDVPVLARVAHPSESDYLSAVRAGADDVVTRYDRGGVTRRLAVLRQQPQRGVPQRAERAIVAHPDAASRARYGRVLRRAGFDVEFAVDAAALEDAISGGERLDVVVMDEALVESPEGAHGWARVTAGDHTLAVVLLQDERARDRGGRRVERTGWLPLDAPTENLLFVINELFSQASHDQRSSPRVLYATLCSFRRAADFVPDYGVSYNISRDGIYVRTMQPPEADAAVWLELRPPGAVRAIHLRGTVAWRRTPGAGGGVSPPGFALQVLPQLCPEGDVERYRAGYRLLVAASACEPSDRAPASAGREGDEQRPRLLVADDEQPILQIYQRIFGKRGIDVTLANDGEEAVRAFRSGRYDAVLTDIDMPRLNGMQLLRAIRAHDDQIPVLIVTGNPSAETAIEALDHGALRYLLKPIEPDKVGEAVDEALRMGRLARFRREAARMVSESGVAALGAQEQLSAALDRALEQLSVHTQPIVNWTERRVIAYEALVRSGEPALPHPGALFDAARRLGRIHELSQRIRVHASTAFADREEQLFVNLHPRDLLDEHLYDAAAPLSALASRVVLEITERASLDDIGDLRGRVARLRALGFRIAVDDLGAGYSGLATFCALEPEVAKIDMSLVRDVDSTPTKQRLVRSLTEACRDLGIALVAEGVETTAELQTLVELGCDVFQGYLFAKPAPPVPAVSWPDIAD